MKHALLFLIVILKNQVFSSVIYLYLRALMHSTTEWLFRYVYHQQVQIVAVKIYIYQKLETKVKYLIVANTV